MLSITHRSLRLGRHRTISLEETADAVAFLCTPLPTALADPLPTPHLWGSPQSACRRRHCWGYSLPRPCFSLPPTPSRAEANPAPIIPPKQRKTSTKSLACTTGISEPHVSSFKGGFNKSVKGHLPARGARSWVPTSLAPNARGGGTPRQARNDPGKRAARALSPGATVPYPRLPGSPGLLRVSPSPGLEAALISSSLPHLSVWGCQQLPLHPKRLLWLQKSCCIPARKAQPHQGSSQQPTALGDIL